MSTGFKLDAVYCVRRIARDVYSPESLYSAGSRQQYGNLTAGLDQVVAGY